MYDSARALAHLQQSMRGTITNAPEVLSAASFDYGRVVTRMPRLAAFPNDTQDIADLLVYASRERIPVSTQGASHTQGGHSLNTEGIVLSTRRLNAIVEISPEENRALVESGVRWVDFVENTLTLGYLPPVVTTNLDTTIGGTHSVGGIGFTSFRYGSQADICLGLQVVLPTGEVAWCSNDNNRDLFDHVLCGLGLFGVITRLAIPIRRFKPRTGMVTAFCDSIHQLIDATLRVMSKGCPGIRDLAGMIVDSPARDTQYVLRCTVEFDLCRENLDTSISALSDGSVVIHAAEIDTRELVLSTLRKRVSKSQWDRSIVDPGFHCILPSRNAERSIADILREFSRRSTGLGAVEYYLLPAYRSAFTKPLLKVPEDDVVFVFGCSPVFDRNQESEYSGLTRSFEDCVRNGEGKHYLIGCTAFGKSDWMLHYGESWSGLRSLKQLCDPNRILNCDFMPYG